MGTNRSRRWPTEHKDWRDITYKYVANYINNYINYIKFYKHVHLYLMQIRRYLDALNVHKHLFESEWKQK